MRRAHSNPGQGCKILFSLTEAFWDLCETNHPWGPSRLSLANMYGLACIVYGSHWLKCWQCLALRGEKCNSSHTREPQLLHWHSICKLEVQGLNLD